MDNVQVLAKRLGIAPEVAGLLIDRGIDTVESATAFLYPKLENGVPASAIARIDEAVARIKQAVEDGESILVFGDYDCDGISATAALTLYLRSLGATVHYFIPRRGDGYGLSERTVERVVETYYPDLMITVDCGITAHDEVELAQDLGVDVIVTDHHEPQDVLPECIVVDPKLGEDTRLKDLCGAGVVYKLIEAMAGLDVAKQYLDIVALATVADVVPLVGDNRIIVAEGLKLLNRRCRKGLSALIRSCDLDKVTSTDIGFRLGPRINALGRLNDDADVVELLTTEDDFVIRELVERIGAANTIRQTLTKKMVEQAHAKLADYDLVHRPCIVLWDDEWETGVLGLVASKLASEFNRPVVLLGDVGDCYKGSARAGCDVNIFEALKAVEPYMIAFGGHKAAAGMSVNKQTVNKFADELCRVIASTYPPETFIPVAHYDIDAPLSRLDKAFFAQLELLEPYGEGNPVPRIKVNTGEVKLSSFGTDHVKARLGNDVEVVAFGSSYLMDAQSMGVGYDLGCEPQNRVFNNREYVQLMTNSAVVKSVDGLRDSAPAFGNYLKTILYPPKEVGIRRSTLDKEVADLALDSGVLFVAYGKEGADRLFDALEQAGKRHLLTEVTVGRTSANPLNSLVLSPTSVEGWQYRSGIVFLDAPLSTGYLAWVGSHAPNPELVVLPSYAYSSQIASLHLDQGSIERTRVAMWALSTVKISGVDELCQRLSGEGISTADAYAHFYILYELGLVVIGQGFSRQMRQGDINLQASRTWVTLNKLQAK